MEAIISYLRAKYHPLTMILYGSFADGSSNQNSDFDALLVVENGRRHHDVSVVDGVQMDVFIYPVTEVQGEVDYSAFVQIFDGKIILDTNGIGIGLKNRVLSYLNQLPPKTAEEIQSDMEWCRKMLLRAERRDAEGYFRWHWLLTDSLEIVCDILGQPYRGPKKSIRWLKENQPCLYEAYHNALKSMDFDELKKWIDCMAELLSHE